MMKMSKKLAALLLALTMMLCGAAATAETATEAPGAAEETTAYTVSMEDVEAPTEEAAAPVLLATVNGDEIMSDSTALKQLVDAYVEYYASQGADTDDPAFMAAVQGLGLRWAIDSALYAQKAKELQIPEMTEEQRAQLESDAKAVWEENVAYLMSAQGLAEDASEEEKAAAREKVLAAIQEMYGYTEESYIAGYVESNEEMQIRENVEKAVLGEIVLSDEEATAYFDKLVEADRQQYEGNIFMYEYMTKYYGQTSYYVPEGYRGVTHILLNVDEDLMNNYTTLAAKLEEQQEKATSDEAIEAEEGETAQTAETAAPAEETAEAAAEPTEAPEEPVTEEMVAAARQAILDSVQPTVDEIMQKFEAGTPFADLIAEYGNDPGMTQEPNKSKGYAVHAQSIAYDPAFKEGAMSLEKVGDVSEPVLGSYGVHLIHYTRDIPAGAVELTDEEWEDIHAQALAEKENELVDAMMNKWRDEADIQYTAEGQALLDEAAAANEASEETVAATDATEEALADETEAQPADGQ